MTMSNIVVAVPLVSILTLATSIDLVDRRIPNGLSIGGALAAFTIHAFGAGSFGLALLGWAFCFACFMPLYLGGGMAAGDVKLMAMVGAFLGPVDGFIACILTLFAGAALASVSLACVAVARRFGAMAGPTASADAMGGAASVTPHALQKIPYAAAIALGATAALLQPVWLANVLPLEILR